MFSAGPDAAAAGGVEYRASGPGGARLLAAEQPPALPRARPQVVQRAPANIDQGPLHERCDISTRYCELKKSI